MEAQYTIKDFLEVKASFAAGFNSDASKVIYINNDTGTSQLYAIAREGGERISLTDFHDSISSYIHSPTEETIIFSKSEGGDENAQLYLLNTVTREIRLLTQKKEVRHNLGSFSPDGNYISYASNERNGKDFDVYIMDAHTFESKCVWNSGGMCAARSFSPSGRYLAIIRTYSNENGDLYLYDGESGVVEYLTPHEGNAVYGTPHWISDESSFFFTTNEGNEFESVARFSLKEKKFSFAIKPNWDIDGISISKVSSYLSVIINEEGYKKLAIYNPTTLELLSYEFPFGEVYGIIFSQDEKYAACTVGGSRNTPDIYVIDMKTGETKQLTESFQGVPSEILVDPELIRFNSFDGLEIPAFIYRPQSIDPTKRLPVIINIHGGPEGQFSPSLALITQYFVHAGYIVVGPNVRGSAGYGKTYMKLDNVEKRMDSVKDIIALRDHLIKFPEVDSKKMVVMGGSYGGFMVLACLAFYPDLWAAGIDTVGIANFVTFLENTAPYRRHLREAEYGSLEKDRNFLESISPINSVENIKAPLFIIHGANDPRVPLSEAEQIAGKLKSLGRTVEMVVYSDEGHGISKLKNRLDAYPKMVDFLERTLQKEIL
jgi:dipeptidyl aminopeptidase/acylaminoacyl peptidase